MHAVIFDIDGTLLQSVSVDDALYQESIRSVLGSVQFRQTWSDYEYVTDSGILFGVAEDNSLQLTDEDNRQIILTFVNLLESYISVNGPFSELPGARRLLRDLQASQHHRVAIATGGWRESAELKLSSAGFDLTGVPMATSSESHSRSEILAIAASRLGKDFESITYYGDGTWDREACTELGWQFVPVGSELGGIRSYEGVFVA